VGASLSHERNFQRPLTLSIARYRFLKKLFDAQHRSSQKGINRMRSHIRSGFIVAAAAASLMSSAAFAQTAEPKAGPTATTVTSTTTTVTATSWMTQAAAGQWRVSKLIGLNVYNNDNEKIGNISEIIADRSGKLDAVVVGAGGFLGIDQRDVAVPYSQISWMYEPVRTAPATTGAGSQTGSNSENALTYPDNRAAAVVDAAHDRRNSENAPSYPDHAVLNMTKEQLKAAPAFKFSR
jgi:sporulation protein YlmC with PRC-barrel domain